MLGQWVRSLTEPENADRRREARSRITNERSWPEGMGFQVSFLEIWGVSAGSADDHG